MSNQSIIEHKANMYYVEFREDYLALCLACTYKKPIKGHQKCKASAYCKALILAIAESWTNEKRGYQQDLTFYMTYPQWSRAMYGLFGRSVVIDSIDELIGEKLLHREPYKLYGKETYRYALNYTEVNRRMKTLADRAPSLTSPQINACEKKRGETQSSHSQRDGSSFTCKRDTGLQVNEDPSTKKHNRESSQNQLIPSSQKRGSNQGDFGSVRVSPPPMPELSLPEQIDHAMGAPNGALQASEQADSYSHTLGETASGTGTPETPPGDNSSVKPASATSPTQTLRFPQSGVPAFPMQQQRLVNNKGKTLSQSAPPHLTEQGQQVYAAWCSLFKVAPRATDKTMICANALYPLLLPWCQALDRTCAQLLDEIQHWMYATDTRGFYQRGVSLCDIERDFEKWQSAMTHAATGMRAQGQRRIPTREEDPYSIAAILAEQNPSFFA